MANSEQKKYFEPIEGMPEGTVAFRMVNAANVNENPIIEAIGAEIVTIATATAEARKLVIDMSPVEKLDDLTAGKLNGALIARKRHGGAGLQLVGLQKQPLELINGKRLNKIFDVTSASLTDWISAQAQQSASPKPN